MSIDYGFDFRNTSGGGTAFPGDPANCSFDNGIIYPNVYGNGATAGWLANTGAAMLSSNWNNAGDGRLAGYMSNANAPANKLTFQIDLPATGSYDIQLSGGDLPGYERAFQSWVFQDGGVAFSTATDIDVPGTEFVDATQVIRTSSADWVTNNAKLTHIFTSTTFTVVIGDGVNATFLSHLRIIGPSGGGVAPGEDDAMWIMPVAV